jgi:maltose alpha-D-glucosyltransferase/alpha-amylase
VLNAGYEDGGSDRYLVPLLATAHETREPEDGDGAWRTMARALCDERELAGRRGTFTFSASAALADLLPGGGASVASAEERRLRVEQSNTSVVLDERLILKIYRLLEPGVNPDAEVGSFLTAVGFRHTPRVAGAAAYLPDDGASCAVASLGEFVASRGDGWSWALEQLTDTDAAHRALDGIAVIGAVTAQMHAALASRPDDPAFPARPATPGERRTWRDGAERQLAGALEAVPAPDRPRLEHLAGAIRGRMAALEGREAASISRIHGDYHLGQLLRTEDGFVVIDFEGEPARPLSERRLPSSPLRDVAGMLRSFDYAARTAERSSATALDADAWLEEARRAFLAAYGPLSADELALLRAFEAEKACYEVRYEANNRPDWTWLPIGALERLAA